jgi:DNA-binding beta-propeller fold protein YncE
MRSSNLITRSLVCLSVFIFLITTLIFQPVQSNSLAQENQTINSPLVSDNPRTGKIVPKVENEKKEYVLGMPIWDNGNFDGVNGLVSEINSSYGESRTADDFILESTTLISAITVQMYSSLNPHKAQLEVYNGMSLDTAGHPINAPIATYSSTSFTQIGSGYGYPIVEFTFDTPSLTLTAGRYWVCPMGLGAGGSSRAFFATTGNGNIQLEPGYFKSAYHNYPNWGLNPLESDYAFKVYAGNTGVDHLSVYAADTNNNRIQRSTDDGATWHMIGYGPGLTVGKFNAPRGVAASADDMKIFVADTLNNRIQRSMDGGITWKVIASAGTISGKVNQPYGLAYDEGMDRLYVADTLNNRIQVAMAAGTAVTPVFNIFAGATAGTAIGKFNQPVSVAVSADSNSIYVSDTSNNRIQVYNIAEGTWSIFAGATAGTAVGKVNQPHGIYIDNMGRFYVADSANNRVQMRIVEPETVDNGFGWTVFMGPGTAIGTVNRPCGVVYAASGNVFVGDTLNNRVQKKNLMTNEVTIVGGPGLPMGYFYQPTGIR